MIKYTPQPLSSEKSYSNLEFFNFLSKDKMTNAMKKILQKIDAIFTKKVEDFKKANTNFNEVNKKYATRSKNINEAINDIVEDLQKINKLLGKHKINKQQSIEKKINNLLSNIKPYTDIILNHTDAYKEKLRTENEVNNHIINITAFVDCFIKHKKDILEDKDFYCNDPQNSPVAKAYNKCHLVEQEAIKEFFIGENGKYKALRKSEVMEFFNKHINVKVCLYCNINYTYAVEEKGESGEDKKNFLYELDHFYPKAKYPWLALSFWNLIPSCHTCNSSYKGEIILKTHPYQEKISALFTYKPKNADFKEESIDVIFKFTSAAEQENITTLGLEERYNQHKDVVIDLYKKSQMYPPEKIEELYKLHKALFSGETEVRNLVFSCVPEEEFHNHSLAKFRFDIAKELGLI